MDSWVDPFWPHHDGGSKGSIYLYSGGLCFPGSGKRGSWILSRVPPVGPVTWKLWHAGAIKDSIYEDATFSGIWKCCSLRPTISFTCSPLRGASLVPHSPPLALAVSFRRFTMISNSLALSLVICFLLSGAPSSDRSAPYSWALVQWWGHRDPQ